METLKAKLLYAGLTELPSDAILQFELDAAAALINFRRNHIPTFKEPVPREYHGRWIEMTCTKILKTGAEGHTAYADGGVSRGFKTDGEYPIDVVASIPWAVR